MQSAVTHYITNITVGS